MKKTGNIINALALLFFFTACQQEMDTSLRLDMELTNTLEQLVSSTDLSPFQLPDSDDYDKIPQDPNNPITKEKVALGKLLFHEAALGTVPMKGSSKGMYSCASCHFATAGFQAGVQQGIGEGGLGFGMRGEGRIVDPDYEDVEVDVQPIRSPTAMNVAYQELMLWNGQFGSTGANVGTEQQWKEGTPIATNHLGFEGVETQAIAALGVHRMLCVDSLMIQMGYNELFDEAFPYLPYEEKYSNVAVGLAIAAYERTILANQAPFQKWLRGEKNAMTDQEKEGAVLFFGKASCATCHKGPALNEMEFYAIGMKDLYQSQFSTIMTSPVDAVNFGRAGFTKRAGDRFKFKVPQLYNLTDSPFYGHGSSFTDLESVVRYKNLGKKENSGVPGGLLSEHFRPLRLNRTEIEAITAFLENALYDPNLERYEPDYVLSNSCIPNNDPVSKVDLNCN